jgi:putative transposase
VPCKCLIHLTAPWYADCDAAEFMTSPRQVLPGSTYLVTRRCSERRFFLRPSARTNAIFRYVLAVAASQHEIDVHAYCVLSNHFHLIVTDPHGRLPDFHRVLDGLVARATNALLGRRESFWDPDSYNATRLEDAESVFEKIAYVLANPVAAGLVRRSADWPGLWSDPHLIDGDPVCVERPAGFFRTDGPMPAVARLCLRRPPGCEASDAFITRLLLQLHDDEDRAALRVAGQGRSFLGVAVVLAQSPRARPAPVDPRRRIRPRIATRNVARRVAALRRLREFAQDYREAFDAWTGGVREVLFPLGTWLMRVRHAAPCAACG